MAIVGPGGIKSGYMKRGPFSYEDILILNSERYTSDYTPATSHLRMKGSVGNLLLHFSTALTLPCLAFDIARIGLVPCDAPILTQYQLDPACRERVKLQSNLVDALVVHC